MPFDLSNEYIRNAAVTAALFTPIFLSIEAFKIYYFKKERTVGTYVLMAIYFVISFFLYAVWGGPVKTDRELR